MAQLGVDSQSKSEHALSDAASAPRTAITDHPWGSQFIHRNRMGFGNHSLACEDRLTLDHASDALTRRALRLEVELESVPSGHLFH